MVLSRKYHVVVFRENQGECRKLRLRGWTLLAIVVLVIGFGVGNLFFWGGLGQYRALQSKLEASEKTVDEQRNQILNLANKLSSIENDLSRVRDFDSKLRVMMNLDRDRAESANAMGGPDSSKEFSKSYLPLHRQELLVRKMHNFMHQLNTDVRMEEVRQQELLSVIRESKDLMEATPSIWPAEGWVSSDFGYRTSPFTGMKEFHKGIDITARVGTPVYAPAKGVVIFSGVDGSYGRSLVLNHGAGILTHYAHLHRVVVDNGKEVARGELIGYIGNTGRSTGPHLHYEIRLSGVCVNPMRYILN